MPLAYRSSPKTSHVATYDQQVTSLGVYMVKQNNKDLV